MDKLAIRTDSLAKLSSPPRPIAEPETRTQCARTGGAAEGAGHDEHEREEEGRPDAG